MQWNLRACLISLFLQYYLLSEELNLDPTYARLQNEDCHHFLEAPDSLELLWNKSALKSQGILSHAKKIDLEGFPNAFNPSIIKIDSGFLLVFRNTPEPILKPWISHIGYVLLNESLDIISEPELLDTRMNYNITPSQSEDARIFMQNNRIYLVYNDNQEVVNTSIKDRRDMYIAELVSLGGQYVLLPAVRLFHEKKLALRTWEKNWIPFVWNDTIMLSYSINPHEVLDINLELGECITSYITSSIIDWKWGSLRGGTPALLVDGEYLAFFHTSKEQISEAADNKTMWHYYMGAYTFSANPPFEVTQISSIPIIDKTFYTVSDSPKRVIYPGGYAVSGSTIYLAYGKDDQEVWIAVIDKDKLKKTLQPVAH